MVLVFAAAVARGVATGSFVAFGIGFLAFAGLLIHLVVRVGSFDGTPAPVAANDPTGRWGSKAPHTPSPAVVCETASATEAHLLRNHLADRGLDSWVEGDQVIWAYPGLYRPRVLVRSDQVEQAAQVLREFATQTSSEAQPAGEQDLSAGPSNGSADGRLA